MRYSGLWIPTLVILLAASVVPARANLITDPGFESCTSTGFLPPPPPGWTASSSSVYCAPDSHTGSYAADLGGELSQTITTITGDNYDFSFWLINNASSPDFFTASFGSDEVFDSVNPATFGYTLEDFTVTATGASTTIEFDGASAGGGWAVDDVSVTDLGPSTPEPASLILLASGLLVITWRFRRGRRAI